MNARVTLSNGRIGKENGGGTVVVLATQDNFEVVLEILKYVRSTRVIPNVISCEVLTKQEMKTNY
jgi:hypothetical protein